MGYNTTILILNDAAHLIEEDKDFPKKLHQAILMAAGGPRGKRIDVSILNHVNACQIICQEHADVEMVVGVGGNTGFILGEGGCYQSEHRLLRTIARQHGFHLVPDVQGKRESRHYKCLDCEKGAGVEGSCYDCGAIIVDGVCPNDGNRHRR